MKTIQFHPEAEREMIAAAAWYESQQTDLGKRFLAAVQECLNKVEINPCLFPVMEGAVRRSLLKTFPFGVVYRINSESIIVEAVMHLHREPGYWKTRQEG